MSVLSWSPEAVAAARASFAGPSSCDVCGHANSMHNELGYCRAVSKVAGICPCDSSAATVDMVADWRADMKAGR